MKEKILAKLRALYPGLNLSQKRLDAIADKLSTKITEETEIEDKLNELNEIFPFADMAKQDDRLRTLEAKHKETPAPNPTAPPAPGSDPKPGDVPEWAKSLIDSNKQLTDKLAAIEKKESGQSMLQTLSKKLTGIPASYYSKRSLPENSEMIDAFVDEVKQDYETFKQEAINDGLKITPGPGGSGGGDGKKPAAVSDEVKAFVTKHAPAPAAAAATK